MNQLYAGVNGTASSGDRTASKHGTADPSRSGSLESRGEELDEQIQQPEIASNVGKLMEIHKEKEAVDARLAELYERWEQLAEDM